MLCTCDAFSTCGLHRSSRRGSNAGCCRMRPSRGCWLNLEGAWAVDELRRQSNSEHTPARVNLGITGVSLPTQALLEFQMAQAQACDAVQDELATVSLLRELAELPGIFSSLAWAS